MFRRNHIFAMTTLWIGLSMVPESVQGGQRGINSREKARPEARASRVACSLAPPPGVLCADGDFR
jgi:hypothetical protein